jgi:hypothetical protein
VAGLVILVDKPHLEVQNAKDDVICNCTAAFRDYSSGLIEAA